MRTSELQGAALDWAVAKCEGLMQGQIAIDGVTHGFFRPSTDWAQAGPIIERENIHLQKDDLDVYWWAKHPSNRAWINGPTPLIAAMRCYVASKLGEDIDIPEELL